MKMFWFCFFQYSPDKRVVQTMPCTDTNHNFQTFYLSITTCLISSTKVPIKTFQTGESSCINKVFNFRIGLSKNFKSASHIDFCRYSSTDHSVLTVLISSIKFSLKNFTPLKADFIRKSFCSRISCGSENPKNDFNKGSSPHSSSPFANITVLIFAIIVSIEAFIIVEDDLD